MTITHDSLDLTIQGPHSRHLDMGPHCAGTTQVADPVFAGGTNSKGGRDKHGTSLYRDPPPKFKLFHYDDRVVGNRTVCIRLECFLDTSPQNKFGGR